MKILLLSYRFSPDVGGIETCSRILADEWVSLGHRVTIMTESGSNGDPSEDLGHRVIRRPGVFQLLWEINQCDVCFHNNISLRSGWPMILISKPWFVTTATWIADVDGTIRTQEMLKRWILRFAKNLHISKAVKTHVGIPGPIVGNPFAVGLFRRMTDVKRDLDLVFLGRLVTDKGCDILIEALKLLASESLWPKLTIIGVGAEKENLQEQVARNGLNESVEFAGVLRAEKLVRCLNRHRVMVIPSTWEEPFGIVALEGMACGLKIIASESGGLAEVVGPSGLTYPKHDPAALAAAIKGVLEEDAATATDEQTVAATLEHYHPVRVAGRYIEAFERVLTQGTLVT